MIYTVTVNPAIDYVMEIDELNEGMVCRSKKEEIFAGGKGINVARVLAELGEKAVCLGFVGGDAGNRIKKELDKCKIEHDFVKISSDTRINVKLKGKEITEINSGGPGILKSETDEFFNKLKRLQEGDILVLSGSVPKNLSFDFYAQVLDEAKGKKIEPVVDAAGELLLATLPYRPILIKPNIYELGEIFKREIGSDEEIVELSKKLQNMGARNVLVSKGSEGAVLVDSEDKVYIAEAKHGRAVNTVGAGDSMVAGFIAAMNEGAEKALELAIAAASATVFSNGLAKKEDILKFVG